MKSPLGKKPMRTRKEILQDHNSYNVLTLEVLLDIRDLLKPKPIVRKKTKTPSAK